MCYFAVFSQNLLWSESWFQNVVCSVPKTMNHTFFYLNKFKRAMQECLKIFVVCGQFLCSNTQLLLLSSCQLDCRTHNADQDWTQFGRAFNCQKKKKMDLSREKIFRLEAYNLGLNVAERDKQMTWGKKSRNLKTQSTLMVFF